MDLLLITTKSFPSFIDRTSSVINYIRILAPIYELNRELDSSTRIEFKAIKLMLALEPKALSPKIQLFGQIIQSFFNVYRFGMLADRSEARQFLRSVFQNTGLFENGPLEIYLWLPAIDDIDEAALAAVHEFLVECINSFGTTTENVEKNANVQLPTTLATQQQNLHETFEMIEKGKQIMRFYLRQTFLSIIISLRLISAGCTLKGLLDIITLRPFFLYAIQSERHQHREHDEFGFDVDGDNAYVTPTARALKYVFSNCYYLLQAFDIWSVENQIIRFVYEIVKNQEYTESMSDILLHYRKKIANQIVLSMTNNSTRSGKAQELSYNENLIDMLHVFHLDAENCCDILAALTQLDHTAFVTEQNQISIRAGILAYGLQR